MTRLIVIGNGTLATDCLTILSERPAVELALVVHDPRAGSIGGGIAAWCGKRDVPVLGVEKNINSPEILEQIRACRPDLIFNIHSFYLFRRELLETAQRGMINFHNAPLPKFRGMHSPSWAIITGATEYGVTWHFIDEGVDTGDIIAQRPVEIADDETAFSLTIKCMLAGRSLFEAIIDDVLEGNVTRTPQAGASSYYSLRDSPNDGYIDFDDDCATIDRFVRGLNFGPAANTFVHAKVRFRATDFIVNRVSCRATDQTSSDPVSAGPGAVLVADGARLEIAARGGTVAIEEAASADGNPLTIGQLVEQTGIRPRDRLETVRAT
ncbi:hypothetical protein BH24PSE2_BH24PSE2_12690 [soil metagenome]